MDFYKELDKVLTVLVKQIYFIFQKYRAMPFDELNVLPQTKALYEELENANMSAFRDIVKRYYGDDDEWIYHWIDSFLYLPSPTIKYAYKTEVFRKRDRLAEALVATEGSKPEYDRAMRYWTQMTGWFGIEIADAATIQKWVDEGVKRVRWVSEHDNRVCGHCEVLDGMVFPIDEIPTKPHPGCRCHLERVTDD